MAKRTPILLHNLQIQENLPTMNIMLTIKATDEQIELIAPTIVTPVFNSIHMQHVLTKQQFFSFLF